MKRVHAEVKRITIPTYIPAEYETLPMFAENRVHQRSSGNPYPNPIVNVVRQDTLEDKEYDCIVLENDYLYLEMLPEIGGRIFTAVDKTNGYNFFYKQSVIKPALIGMLGLWISGGVEFNWPIHHRPSTFLPVDSCIERHEDGSVTAWLGEYEPLDRMKGMVGIHLTPDSAILETKVRVFNRTDLPHSFLWWENAAVPVNEQYRIFFPPDVQSVSFHYKKAVGGYPIMDEFYNVQDNRGGRDIRPHINTEQATSFFSGHSRLDFFGGYDEGKKAGVIHYASHHTSVGKKLFTWGYRSLCKAWESALTDSDGEYAELMAGSYTDNQPDFTWLEPFEVKEFSQSWYPYKDIGEVQQANGVVALSLDDRRIGLYAVKELKDQRLIVKHGDTIIHSVDLTLPVAQTGFYDVPGLDAITEITILDGSSTTITYVPLPVGHESIVPDANTDYLMPCDIHVAEDAFQTGLHVAQYRDPIKDPDIYWKRALELSPGHVGSLIGLSWFSLTRLRYAEAQRWAEQAVARQQRLNPNPPSSLGFYFLGLSLKYQGKLDEAVEVLHKGLWNRSGINYCSMVLAQIYAMRNEFDEALSVIDSAARLSGYNQKAQQLRASLLRRLGRTDEAAAVVNGLLEEDPLDYYALHEASLLDLGAPAVAKQPDHNGILIDIASDYLDAGLIDDATSVLDGGDRDDAMISYLLLLTTGEYRAGSERYIFPSRRWELVALSNALQEMPDNEQASLLLGNLYFGQMREYEAAHRSWLNAGGSAQALRNLAVSHFRKNPLDPEVLPLLAKAIELEPTHLQLRYEYNRVLELTETDAARRFDEWQAMGDYVHKRDDIYLQGVKALNHGKRFEEALQLLAARQFIPCEGGEHAVAEEYLVARMGLAIDAMREGAWHKALTHLADTKSPLPSNLGGGVWHQVMLVPYRYLEGLCKEQIEPGSGRTSFAAVYDFPINYFTLMYMPAFPVWKALAARQLGYHQGARDILCRFIQQHESGLVKPAEGYFAATPFFEVFIEDRKSAKRLFHKRLLAFAKAANGEEREAVRICHQVLDSHPSQIKTRLLKEFIDFRERRGILT